MKYLSAFVVAALFAGAAGLVYRSAGLTADSTDAQQAHANHESAPEKVDHSKMDHSKTASVQSTSDIRSDSSADHSKMHHGKGGNSNHQDSEVGTPKDGLKPPPGTSIASRMTLNAHEMGGVTHLLNTLDPVSGDEIASTPTNLDYQGFLIAFNSQANADTFKASPLRYLSRISLEYVNAESVKLVDASTYKIRHVSNCFSMGGEIDYDGDVYLLHRGYKFFFCCWPGGCGEEFVEDPSTAYEHYGLKEVDGKLLPIK